MPATDIDESCYCAKRMIDCARALLSLEPFDRQSRSPVPAPQQSIHLPVREAGCLSGARWDVWPNGECEAGALAFALHKPARCKPGWSGCRAALLAPTSFFRWGRGRPMLVADRQHSTGYDDHPDTRQRFRRRQRLQRHPIARPQGHEAVPDRLDSRMAVSSMGAVLQRAVSPIAHGAYVQRSVSARIQRLRLESAATVDRVGLGSSGDPETPLGNHAPGVPLVIRLDGRSCALNGPAR